MKFIAIMALVLAGCASADKYEVRKNCQVVAGQSDDTNKLYVCQEQ